MALEKTPYQVLARKYRPKTFSELIGQEIMVTTLKNAIATNRVAQAFVLTGVRGVGKTTTARLIASALNCLSVKAGEQMAQNPCGTCANCKDIAESRHLEVMELDAATKTGVDSMREIIESVRYAPQSARFKVYIIDEVHMLSTNAFNALLKTLEEPPPHVKFIFATTEIRKIPITVLSRCQRFNLRRVETTELAQHLKTVVALEKAEVDSAALDLLARAAEGSVRDALSLLDQAIVHGGGKVTADNVRVMLGVANRLEVMRLFRHLMAGEIKEALAHLAEQIKQGAEPAAILQDLLEIAHYVTRVKVTGEVGTDALVSGSEREEAKQLAEQLSVADLTRSWQILLKGLEETERAPAPATAAEMVVIRLTHAASLPDPAKLIQKLSQARGAGGSNDQEQRAEVTHVGTRDLPKQSIPTDETRTTPRAEGRSKTNVVVLPSQHQREELLSPMPQSFFDLVTLFEKRHEGVIGKYLFDDVSLVAFKPGAVVFHPLRNLPATLPGRMRELLQAWTGQPWQVTLSKEEGAITLREADTAREKAHDAAACQNPIVKKVLEIFPGATIASVRPLADHESETS